MLYLSATVVYTDPPVASSASDPGGTSKNGRTRIQVRVDSKVRNIEHGVTKPTGQFNYTFTVDKDVKVMPRSYTEFMMYIDARRRVRGVLESLMQDEADTGAKERVTE